MSSMHTYLDARRLKDLASDPDYMAPPTAEQQAAFDVYAQVREQYRIKQRAAQQYDMDLGAWTGHQADPRTPDDDERFDLIAQIDEAESLLAKARALIEDAGPDGSLTAGRSLMTEAIGWLQED